MKLNSYKPESSVQSVAQASHLLNWCNQPGLDSSEQKCAPDIWVKLRERPSPFCFDEALLVCRASEDEWLAWIPDFGEVVLHNSQVCDYL